MVRRVKEDFDHMSVLDELPGPQFKEFIYELERLNYFIDPDYELLRQKLLECIEYNGVNDNDPFDWELPVTNTSNSSVQLTPQKATTNTPRYIF